MQNRIGLWLIGARGSVSTTALLGLGGLIGGRIEERGLVSALSAFSDLNLSTWDQFVVGGHDIRDFRLVEQARIFSRSTRAFDPELVESAADFLEETDQRIRPGIFSSGDASISRLATPGYSLAIEASSNAKAVELIQRDLMDFQASQRLQHIVVINVTSTEPSVNSAPWPHDWTTFSKLLDDPKFHVPPSTLYAIAAFHAGCSYVNFTPSLGSNSSALKDLAIQRTVRHVGQDGKTGETLVKSALAPMFLYRNLEVMSWVGHNILGNLDGAVLSDPSNKTSKVKSKDQLLAEILGYAPQSHISIENIASLGDWKTAWDHIHFKGFLGTPMVMQFIWQGCDSALAAPLVLDLARFTERAWRAGQIGVMEQFACFFKSPMQVDATIAQDHSLGNQFQRLIDWAVNLCHGQAATDC
ncbi:MAG TPA: inositol-3-phosphate synthase [Pirellulaceae bacterium]|nr:inositol-3-phosphate synthase [Pirellulaceae bacterium]HMO92956.1 inositol-3-phosphate synthase [Pirellulaceae bacterium]HMP68479.1 inositol-3-phosphate synthase [Pirellulaceae bacterium]